MLKQNTLSYQSEEVRLIGKWKTIENKGDGDIQIENSDSDLFEIDYTLELPKATYLQGQIREEDCGPDEYESMLERSRIDSDYMEVTEEGYFTIIQPIEEGGETGVYFTD
ncbi:MAG: hypothetical protein J07AB43_15590 [Candidatus Nanosalina sp. J07AB43]|jgi:hypothetical protein|nr:MAG: hypothetical protein J07AB43_15590 [Candidatus Nanosalina sp. J07AB43]